MITKRKPMDRHTIVVTLDKGILSNDICRESSSPYKGKRALFGRNDYNGTALVFVTLIALLIGGVFAGIGTMNYIEILRSRGENNLAKARENAMVALNLAVGKLQELAGDDRCATSPGPQMARGGDRKHYTGVWETAESNSENFRGWLVSGANSGNFHFDPSDGTNTPVVIFSDSCVGDRVRVTPLDIIDGSEVVGHYGFWICDESQKVKINCVDRYCQSNDFRSKKVRYCCPQVFDSELIFGENNLLKNNFLLTKIDFQEQLADVDGGAFESFIKNKHAVTFHSYGILSDAKKCGLRRDLSKLASTRKSMAYGEYLFEVRDGLPAYVPTLDFLLSFFSLSSANKNGCLPVTATCPLPNPQNLENAMLSPYASAIHGIFPVLAQANVNIGVTVIDGHLAITFVPQILLWNPHTVDLETTDYVIELCVPYEKLNYLTSLTLLGFADSQGAFSKIGTFPLVHNVNGNPVSTILKLKFSTAIRAGEVRMFSLQNSQSIDCDSGNYMVNTDSRSKFLHIDTGKSASGFSAIKLICTNGKGNANMNWDCFNWRLIDSGTGNVLQEIAGLNPLGSNTVESERALVGGNTNYLSFCTRMKYGVVGDTIGQSGVRWLAHCNLRAPYICQGYAPDIQLGMGLENWNFSTSIVDSVAQAKFDNAMINYLSNLTLFCVPESTHGILNVGYLRHANFSPFGCSPSPILGNSRTNPLIPLNKTMHKNSIIPGIGLNLGQIEFIYDYSYLLNGNLFDGYFVSTAKDGILEDLTLDSLTNKRFRLLRSREQFSNENPAEVLLIDGPFNVNSQDALTWQCVLSSIRNRYGEVVFPRFYSEKMIDQFSGFGNSKIRVLSEKLAKAIGQCPVPFTTIGDFANRRVDVDPANCTVAGILQEAIDESGINSGTFINFQKNLPAYDDRSASGYLEENLPNVVNQGDILQATSHFLCTRGDTFLVRAFGDHVDKSGKVMERAYCEAVVQRLPEYINSRENTPNDDLDKLSRINKRFGRRYEVILFRWLDENEI
ncbi:MAG: hypothetical protein LBR91_00335 [Puniceicoccales bacterium]|jgi:hypothetical protein|nr:hypothetical protein [Puniceicoccales bacterium]